MMDQEIAVTMLLEYMRLIAIPFIFAYPLAAGLKVIRMLSS